MITGASRGLAAYYAEILAENGASVVVSGRSNSAEQLDEVVAKMRKHGKREMLFVYDRGYPSEDFIQQHLDLAVDFLFRLPRNPTPQLFR